MASGSIAQVHRATLARPRPPRRRRLRGESEVQTVAVKVRHPRVAELIQRDFARRVVKIIALIGLLNDFVNGF